MFLYSILAFLFAVGVLITIHELGHYAVARACGVKVLRFSIGFGRPLLQRVNKEGTIFSLSWIPLGGYVKMLDEREGNVPETERHMAFTQKSVYQRMAIIVAGPLANFIFAILAYTTVFMQGTTYLIPTVGEVAPQSPAAVAGLPVGAEITHVDGARVRTWQDIRLQLLAHINADEPFKVQVMMPDNQAQDILLRLDAEESADPLQILGINPMLPKVPPVLANVNHGQPADDAGLMRGDKIIAVKDEPIDEWGRFVEAIQSHTNRPLPLTVLRDGRTSMHIVVPEEGPNGQGLIGVNVAVDEHMAQYTRTIECGVGQALVAASVKTWDLSTLTLSMLYKMLIGQVSLSHLSGPISIAEGAGTTASIGFVAFLSFLAIISISLGVLNLLPIPILDGGQLFYCLIEWVKGSPLSERKQEIAFQVGLVFLLSVMSLAIYNDVMRLL